MPPAAPREGRGEAHDPLDLHHGVAAHIERRGGGALLLTEIETARELADDQDIDAVEQFRLDG